MSSEEDALATSSRPGPRFATTRWSMILAAGSPSSPDARAALETLCQSYWYPVYAFVRRRVGHVNDAQDLTQSFFARLLDRDSIAAADPQRGRFRSFLLTACQRFLINEWHKGQAAKRGGGQTVLSLDFQLADSKYAVAAVHDATPENAFEQQWAMTLLGQVLDKLRDVYVSRGKRQHFEELKPFLSGVRPTEEYQRAADALGMTNGAVKVAAHRMRQKYRELIRSEIAQTVESEDEVEDEIRHLFRVLGG